MPKHTAIYVRVSSRDQSHASQLPDLERWAQAHDGAMVWYKDTFTGKTMNRPGMAKLMADMNTGKVGTVVVWRLDRLGRTAKGLTALFEDLRAKGIGLVSLKDGLDLSTPAGRLMANVLASVAAYETEVRAERVHAGQLVARKKGKRWGGSKKGWRWKVSDAQVTAIREMHAGGKSITAIASVTGLSRPTIYRVLRSPQPR